MSLFCVAMLEAAASSSMWLDYAKTLLVLGGICLLALVGAKVLLPKVTGYAASVSNQIHVFARYSLEPRKTLYLVKTGKAVVLLATSGDAVHFMTTLNSEDFEESDTQAQSGATRDSAFQRITRNLAERKQDKSL